MTPIGSIEFSGLSNQSSDSLKVVQVDFDRTRQQQIADIQQRERDEKRDTVKEPVEPNAAKVNEDGKQNREQNQGKKKQDQKEEEQKFVTAEDGDRGQKFDFSA